jgi:hypothetical protein
MKNEPGYKILTDAELGKLLMLCGAIIDMAEMLDRNGRRQETIKKIREDMEKILMIKKDAENRTD